MRACVCDACGQTTRLQCWVARHRDAGALSAPHVACFWMPLRLRCCGGGATDGPDLPARRLRANALPHGQGWCKCFATRPLRPFSQLRVTVVRSKPSSSVLLRAHSRRQSASRRSRRGDSRRLTRGRSRHLSHTHTHTHTHITNTWATEQRRTGRSCVDWSEGHSPWQTIEHQSVPRVLCVLWARLRRQTSPTDTAPASLR